MTAATEPFREVVSLAVAAFVGCDDDAAVRGFLVSAGVSAELADELVAFVPIAFGRKVLDALGVSTWPTFDVMNHDRRPSAERRFDEFPVYLTAQEAVSGVEREVFQRLATWSAEVNAVNGIIASGPASAVRLTKLLLWAPHLVTGSPAKPPAPLADVFGAHVALARAVEAHGLRVHRAARGVAFAPGEVWEAKVFGYRCSLERCVVQVDFVFHSSRLAKGRALVESFAGEGATLHDAVRHAFEKFLLGSFHVVLSAFFGVTSEQVDWEDWSGPHGTFRVALGPLVQVGAAPPPDAFAGLVGRAKERVVARGLTREVHWLRLFHARSQRPTASEALFDGESWPELLADVEAWPFPPSDSWYSERCFFVLVPAE